MNSRNILYKKHILIKWILINSNISSSCLHSKDVVLHVGPDLLKNMLQCQLGRWYDKVPPNLALTFPKLDSLQRSQLYVTPSHQELKVLTLRWHHNLASVSADNKPTRPLHFLSSLQSGPNFLLIAHRYLLDWMNWFLSSGNQSLKGWLPQLYKSLRKGSLQ